MRDKINKILKFSGLNKKEFAEKIGVSQVGLNNYINNDRIPTTEVILKIKQSFNEISLDWLFTGEGTMLKNEEIKEVSVPATGQNTSILEQENAFLKRDIQRLEEQIKDKEEKEALYKDKIQRLERELKEYRKSSVIYTGQRQNIQSTL